VWHPQALLSQSFDLLSEEILSVIYDLAVGDRDISFS
jgi:hypothetical protein